MATYTTNSGIKKIATGDESGTWGTSTNTNFDIIDRVAAGVGDITLSGTTHPLTTSDGSASDGQYHVLVLGGSPPGTNTITHAPNDAKLMYFVKNNSGQSAIFSQGSGANVTISNGATGIIYADGAGASAAVNAIIDSTTLSALGITASAADLNRTDVATVGLTEASKVVTADANGVVTFDNGTIEEVTSVTSSSNAATINLRDGNVFEHDLTENVTYTFSNPAASGRASCFVVKVIQDSTARTITWPASVDWAAATAPTLTTTNNGVDVFGLLTIDGGTTYYGFTLGQAMA